MKRLFSMFMVLALIVSASVAIASGYSSIVVTHTEASVGVASGVAIAANKDRTYLLLVNDSDSVIYIGIGATAVLNKGIRLNPGGGSYEFSPRFGNLSKAAINAISSGASKNLMITEGQ